MIIPATEQKLSVLCNDTDVQLRNQIIDMDNVWLIALDGRVVAAAGCPEAWEGYGQLWGVFDRDKIKGHGRWLIRECRELIQVMMTKNNYRQLRVFCFTLHDVKFNSLLGLEFECIMGSAAPDGEDVAVMVYNRRH